MSKDTKTAITVLLLIFFYPVGVILMWMWMTWPTWVKILLSIGILLGVLLILVVIGSSANFILNSSNP